MKHERLYPNWDNPSDELVEWSERGRMGKEHRHSPSYIPVDHVVMVEQRVVQWVHPDTIPALRPEQV